MTLLSHDGYITDIDWTVSAIYLFQQQNKAETYLYIVHYYSKVILYGFENSMTLERKLFWSCN